MLRLVVIPEVFLDWPDLTWRTLKSDGFVT